MQVYKFGGASIATPDRMRALLPIIQDARQPIVCIVSALGKTTNALESIVNAAAKGKKDDAHQQANVLEHEHLDYAKTILTDKYYEEAKNALGVIFTELQWGIDSADPGRFDYSYDQVVCLGELMSTRIFCFYLLQEGLNFEWIDVRDIVRTDDTYRDARVDWSYTQQRVNDVMMPVLNSGKNIITQGFIGATSDNASVTLGREGSDYTAALIGAMIKADGVTIWKDVEGLLNADPKIFPNTVKIEAITYHEVIEMAFYGAQVIHPKTIKPLQNNNIPLYVKCFLDKDLKGTVIKGEVNSIFYPPLIVLKKNQILLQLTTKDFSFISEDNLSELYGVFHDLKIKANLIQNAAISFVACVDNKVDTVKKLVDLLSRHYNVSSNEDVELLTIRHYSPEILFDMTKNRYKLLEQKTRQTVQVVMK